MEYFSRYFLNNFFIEYPWGMKKLEQTTAVAGATGNTEFLNLKKKKKKKV